jgi:xanthine dehydrogenase accessory factor
MATPSGVTSPPTCLKEKTLWQFIETRLAVGQPVMLLVVAESSGSSPGRAGFKMAIGADDQLHGSIGGGIMEVKLVELGKKLLKDEASQPIIKKQIHSKNVSLHQSGMICSGEQTILYCFLTSNHQELVYQILKLLDQFQKGVLCISGVDDQIEIELISNHENDPSIQFQSMDEKQFIYRETLGHPHQLYIIGGGHCALALSELMSKLNFYIHVMDDRPHLNTLEQNHFAHQKHVVESYDKLALLIPSGDNVYVVVMTLGYRTDIQALLQFRDKSFAYLGVLGSESKVETMKETLRENAFPERIMESWYAPIGFKINSHTPEEIAVSIAAEIIRHRNKN